MENKTEQKPNPAITERIAQLRPLASIYRYDSTLAGKAARAESLDGDGWLSLKAVERLLVGHYVAARNASREIARLERETVKHSQKAA